MGPLSVPWWFGTKLHRWLVTARALPAPAVVTGSVSAGGSGKTPLTAAIAERLSQRWRVVILSGGYGRKGRGTVGVTEGSTVDEVGDEPLLLYRRTGLPVVVDSNRQRAAAFAMSRFRPQLFLLDDAMQHWAVAPQVTVAVVTPADLNRDRLLPFGRLREPLSALERADIRVCNLKSGGGEAPDGMLRANYRVSGVATGEGERSAEWLPGRRVLLTAGIADFAGFRQSALAAGADVVAEAAFRDHRRYGEKEIAGLTRRAKRLGAAVLTTEKDWMRLGALPSHWAALLVDMEVEEPFYDRLAALVEQALVP